MQSPYFVALLAAGLVFGVTATQLPERGPGAPGWSVTERVAQFAGIQPRSGRHAELLPIVPASAITTVTGRPLTCLEIRGMDEVDLIADESYCK